MKGRILGAILLIAATSIGAGMLALPVLTAKAGFLPSTLAFILIWLATTFTAFLVLEVNLWFKGDVNLITMARMTLGRGGEIVTWIFFLMLLYSLTAAYLAGSGTIISCQLASFLGIHLPSYAEPFILLFIFILFLYFGTRPVDLFNRVCMYILIGSYIGIIAFATPYIDHKNLMHQDFSSIWIAVPVIITSFGFHVIIPVLTNYLNRDLRALKKTIWIGSLIPLIVYLIWEYVILSVVPKEGENGLYAICGNGSMVSSTLATWLKNEWITTFASTFSFFAIITSFIAIALSLSSFLRDGMKIKKGHQGNLIVLLLTFLPPLIFVLCYPRGFLVALEFAGINVAFLHGILPALMVLKGRKMAHLEVPYRVRCSNFTLNLTIALCFLLITYEILEKLNG